MGVGTHPAVDHRARSRHNEDMQNRSSEDLITIVGELAVAVWHLGYLVEEIGNALGHNVGNHSASHAREVIRRRLESEELPPWSTAREDKILRWLDDVEECVGAYQDVVQAFATASDRIPARRLAGGARRPVREEDLKALLGAAHELSRAGDRLVDKLGLQVERGSIVHGYNAIAETLYSAYRGHKVASAS